MQFIKQWYKEIQAIQPRCWDSKQQSQDYLDNMANWERIYFSRKISIWLTFFLKDKPVTPDQVTLAWVLIGIAGAMLLVFDYYIQLLGLGLLYFAWLLDNVDGELARYRQQFSMTGNFLDMLGHQIIPPMFFAGLGVHELLLPQPSLIGVIAAMSAAVWVIPMTKMQDNVLLLLAIQALSMQTAFSETKPSRSSNVEKTLKSRCQSLIAFLFTDTAMLYLLIFSVVGQQTQVYLIFYGLGMPLMIGPKFWVRNKELRRISTNPEQIAAQFRPEWKDH